MGYLCNSCWHDIGGDAKTELPEKCPSCGGQFDWGRNANGDHKIGDASHWPGPEYVFDPAIGSRGQWVPLTQYRLLPRDEKTERELVSLLRESPHWRSHYVGMPVLASCVAEICRLRGLPAPPTPTRALEAMQLRDKVGQLSRDLRLKRAECDELRDRVRDLEAQAKVRR